MGERLCEFQAVDVDEKYKTLIRGGVVFAILGAAMMLGGYLFFESQDAYAKDAPQTLYPIIPFFMVFIIAYGVGIFKRGLVLKNLFAQSQVKGMRFNDAGLMCSVLLLEGVYSEALVNKKMADFEFEWSSVQNFIVEPRRGHHKKGSPPYYKITFVGKGEDMNSSCYILREPFKRDDEKIVEFVKAQVGEDHLVLNDDIYV